MSVQERPEGGNFPQVCFDPGECSEQERVERDGEQRACQQQRILLLLEHSQCDTSCAKYEGEFPNLTAPGGQDQYCACRSRKERPLQDSQYKFAQDDDHDEQEHLCGMGEQIKGI